MNQLCAERKARSGDAIELLSLLDELPYMLVLRDMPFTARGVHQSGWMRPTIEPSYSPARSPVLKLAPR